MKKKNAKVVSTFAFLLAFGLAGSLRAAEFAWTGGGMDAFWNNPANWSSDGGSPRATGGDSLVFGNEGTNRPGRLDQDYQIVDLDVENLASEHVLDLNSQKLIYTGTLRIGYAVTN